MLNHKTFFKNKKGQLSDAMTWIVATLVIIFVLGIFFFASSVLTKIKEIETESKLAFLGDGGIEGASRIKIKNAFAYEKNSNNQELINKWVSEKNEKI